MPGVQRDQNHPQGHLPRRIAISSPGLGSPVAMSDLWWTTAPGPGHLCLPWSDRRMDYLNLTNRELAILVLYASQGCATLDPDLAKEVAVRLDPDIKKESAEAQEKRYRKMLTEVTKIQAIKAYRAETGCALKDAKDYIDGLEATPNQGRIIEGPKMASVTCDECRSIFKYLPEEVEEHNGTDYSGGSDGYKRVKCPRPGCPGHGYIETW